MDSIAPATLASEPPAQPAYRSPETPAEADVAPNQSTDDAAAARDDLAPDKLLVHMDAEAGGFAQTLTDASSQETTGRYPSETQLAHSRAIVAYVRVLAQR